MQDVPQRVEQREDAAQLGGLDGGALSLHGVQHGGLDGLVAADGADLFHDQRLDVVGGYGRRGAGGPALRAGGSAHVVPVRLAPALGVRGRHGGVAGGAAQEPGEQRGTRATSLLASRAGAVGERGLGAVKRVLRDDAVVLAVVDLGAEADLTDVDGVREQRAERVLRPCAPLLHAVLAGGPGLGAPAAVVQGLHGAGQGAGG